MAAGAAAGRCADHVRILVDEGEMLAANPVEGFVAEHVEELLLDSLGPIAILPFVENYLPVLAKFGQQSRHCRIVQRDRRDGRLRQHQ